MMLSRRLPTIDFGSRINSVLTAASVAVLFAGTISVSLQNFFEESFNFQSESPNVFGNELIQDWKLASSKFRFATDDQVKIQELLYQSNLLQSGAEAGVNLPAPSELLKPVRIQRVAKRTAVLPRKLTPTKTFAKVVITQSSSIKLTPSVKSELGADSLTVYQSLHKQWGKLVAADFKVSLPLTIQIATTNLDPVPESLSIQNGKCFH
jgi:hypothetical protein